MIILSVVILWAIYGFIFNKMSPYEIASVILTTITSILILFTLFEMKNQRESIYKPDLILRSSKRFYMYSEKNGDIDLLSLWTNEKIDASDQGTRDDLIKDPERNLIGIPIYNIGMGTAKDVKIKWDYDKEEIQKLIINKTKDNPLWAPGSNIETTVPLVRDINAEDDIIDYILPSQIKSSSENFYIPVEFQNDFNYFLPILLRENNISSIPKLRLKLCYKDIANQNCHKEYILIFSPKSWASADFDDYRYMDDMEMDLKIKEI